MKKTVLIILAILVPVAVLFFVGYWIITEDLAKKTASESPTPTPAISGEMKTYENNEFKFSFQYPLIYVNYDAQLSGAVGELFNIAFRDPARETERKVNDCVINESFNWANSTPKQAECTQYLAELTQPEKDKVLQSTTGLLHSKSIIVQVFDDSGELDVKTWLINRYELAQTELQDYAPGKQITMAGETGYFSNIGCCADYVVTYTVKHGDKIYILGTNYELGDTGSGATEDNTLLQEVAKTFEFVR